MAEIRVLVVDDEEIARQNLSHVLRREGYRVDDASSAEAALGLLQDNRYQLVLTDLRMPGMDGLSLLRLIKERHPTTEVIVITAHASTGSAVDAMRAGAFFYVEKPFRLPDVRKIVQEALEKHNLKDENAALKAALAKARRGSRIVAISSAMEALLDTATRVGATECSVLIHGETGTGKELIARHLHDCSHRAAGPFVALNCGVLTAELLANELFGHDRGAFTGAVATKPGLLEAAEGGTLFLDEVTEMAPAIQVKLLRLLQEREFFRVGGVQAIKADIRVLAATNREPEAAVAEGSLRQDLYFRLNVVGLRTPPLRERKEDIPVLAMHFVARYARRMERSLPRLSADALDCLMAYPFPGNVRELENLMERALALSADEVIETSALPDHVRRGAERTVAPALAEAPLPLAEHEKRHVLAVLDQCQGNRAKAARLLGIDRVSLWRKLKAYEQAGSA